jgi:hypothetical protein
MMNVTVRRILCVVGGIVLGFLFYSWTLDILSWTPSSSGAGTVFIFFLIIGIIIGLIFEKATRASYYAKMGKLPPGARNPLGRAVATAWMGRGAYIAAGLYILYKIGILIALFALGFGITPAIRLQLISEAIGELILFIVSLWLYLKWRSHANSHVKKAALFFLIFFAILTVADVTALVILKPNLGIAQIPINGSSGYQAVPLASFNKISIAALNEYNGSVPYFVEINGTIANPSIPDTKGMFSVTDASGQTAYVIEMNQGTTTVNLQAGGTITIYGAIQDVGTPPISASSSQLIDVKACAPSGTSTPEFYCG